MNKKTEKELFRLIDRFNRISLQGKPIMDFVDQLINSEIEEKLQEKLNDYDVSSLEYQIIEAWIKAIREE